MSIPLTTKNINLLNGGDVILNNALYADKILFNQYITFGSSGTTYTFLPTTSNILKITLAFEADTGNVGVADNLIYIKTSVMTSTWVPFSSGISIPTSGSFAQITAGTNGYSYVGIGIGEYTLAYNSSTYVYGSPTISLVGYALATNNYGSVTQIPLSAAVYLTSASNFGTSITLKTGLNPASATLKIVAA